MTCQGNLQAQDSGNPVTFKGFPTLYIWGEGVPGTLGLDSGRKTHSPELQHPMPMSSISVPSQNVNQDT